MKDRKIKKTLSMKLEIPEIVEEKMKEGYQMIGIQTTGKIAPRNYRKVIAIAAAVVMLAATSLATLAATGFFTKEVLVEKENLSYKFQMNYELTPYAVKAVPRYIPDGYTQFEEGKYDKDGEHKNGISICEINASWLEAQPKALDAVNLKDLEKTTLGGMEAHLLSLNYDSGRTKYTFDKRIYLFNAAEGYVIQLFGGNDISMAELKKVAENLQITVDKSQPMEYTKQSEADQDIEEELQRIRQAGAGSESILHMGDSYSNTDVYGKEVEYTIVEAKFVDSISDVEGYDSKYFYNYEAVQQNISDDGTLKSYDRISYRLLEDGNVDLESGSKQTVGRKFLMLKGKMKNNGQEAAEGWVWGNVTNLIPGKNGNYAFNNVWTEPYDLDSNFISTEPVYFAQSQYSDEPGDKRQHFFFCNLQPGEEIEYTVMWIVDADKIENMFIELNLDGMENGNSLFADVNS